MGRGRLLASCLRTCLALAAGLLACGGPRAFAQAPALQVPQGPPVPQGPEPLPAPLPESAPGAWTLRSLTADADRLPGTQWRHYSRLSSEEMRDRFNTTAFSGHISWQQ